VKSEGAYPSRGRKVFGDCGPSLPGPDFAGDRGFGCASLVFTTGRQWDVYVRRSAWPRVSRGWGYGAASASEEGNESATRTQSVASTPLRGVARRL